MDRRVCSHSILTCHVQLLLECGLILLSISRLSIPYDDWDALVINGCEGWRFKREVLNTTPFQKCAADSKSSHKNKDESLVDKYGKQLKEYGFNYHGTEVMYSGVLGTELTCEIYSVCVYYQRLRHMVGDKYQVRSTGAVNPVTRHPSKGRKFGGGICFGEMERDSLLAHGAAYLLHDRLHTCSDYHTADICVRCGSLLSTTPVLQQKSSAAFAMGLGSSKESKVICRVCNSSRDMSVWPCLTFSDILPQSWQP